MNKKNKKKVEVGDCKEIKDRKIAKVVYFDEDSATDYLIIAEGGRLESSSKNEQQYSAKGEVGVDAKATLKKPWILSLLGSFFDASVDAKLNVSGSAMGQKLLNKTISNTVLSDYLANAKEDPNIEKLRNLKVSAIEGSMAHAKMFTPYLAMINYEDTPLKIAQLDEVLMKAKGYYELIGANDDVEYILRFNIGSFKNNYGLIDICRMKLVFHGVLVGEAPKTSLSMEAEMSSGAGYNESSLRPGDIINDTEPGYNFLKVYDMICAGVEL